MHGLIAWCGFLGAWLVVAGSVYQAALELREEEFRHEDFEELEQRVTARSAVPPVSPWWWLVPPAGYWLHRRRARLLRQQVFEAMTRSDVETMLSYISKATGWLYVGGGALLIAVKETWELREAYEWHAAVFWVLLLVMVLACTLNTAGRLAGARRMVEGAPSQ